MTLPDTDGFHGKPAVLTIFVLTYLGIAIGHIPGLKVNRVGIALLGGIAMMIFSGVDTHEVVSYVNWPTIFLLFGFFVISAQLRLSGFYDQVAGGVSARLGHPARFLLILMVVTAGLSAILNHDIVVYVFTPIVGAALLRQRLNPIPFLIALTIASNVGAAATLIGNAQDMMIGEVAHLSFARYLFWGAVPVTVSLAASYGLIWYLSKNQLTAAIPAQSAAVQQSYQFDKVHTIKGIVILVLVVGLFFTSFPKELIALAAAGIHLASTKFRTDDLLRLVEWPILILFMGLFVVTGAFQTTGYGEQATQWLTHADVNLNHHVTLTLVTAGLSNLIGNSATVMLLLKVVDTTNPVTAYILALANSFGGSLLIIGSVANLITVQQARDMGIKISFWDFARLGIPCTLAALAALLAWAWMMQ